MTQTIRWCTPQCILDVANTIDWAQIHHARHENLAHTLQMLVSSQNLPRITTAPPIPSKPPKLRAAPDVPQVLLDVLNGIDWTKVPQNKCQTLGKRLSTLVFGALGRLPRRTWK